jgi:hypothetical protein
MTSNAPAPASAPSPGYRGALALVIFLGALIMMAVGALIAGAFLGAARRDGAGTPYSATVPAANQRVESAEIDGNRILLRLSGGDGQELVVLDVATGRVIGRIKVQ